MSDNSTPIAGGDTYATDQAATINGAAVTPSFKFPINKIGFGTHGTVREVDAANPLPTVGSLFSNSGSFTANSQIFNVSNTVGVASGLLTLSGTFTGGIVVVRGTNDFVQYDLLTVVNSNTFLTVAQIAGSFHVLGAANYKHFEVRCTQVTTGTINAELRMSAAIDITFSYSQSFNSFLGTMKLTDGANNAAVKSASTVPVAADPALVVAISPNSTAAVSAAAILNVTASGTLTASDAVVAAPIGDGTIISGASTAGSVVAVAVPDGLQAWTLMIKGYVSGAIYTEASNNSTTGTDGDWVEVKGRRTGTAPGVESVVYAMVSNGYYRGNAAGFKYIRARLIGGTSPTIQWVLSYGQGATFLNSGIPLGSSVIGKVGIDQTTPGTTNAVQVTNASFAVTGTFFQATQPVSLAALPALTAGAAAIGSITNTSFAVTNAGTFAVQSAATLSAETTKVIGTVNLSAAQTLAAVTAITNALPAGANTLGAVKITDGTNNPAIKAASTLSALTDAALAVQDINLGNQADATAATDAGTFSLLALFKRLLAKITTQLPAALGGAVSAASLPVVLSSDTATGTITTQNLVPGGVATAGSAVEITLNGAASIASQVVGTYTGALSLQVLVDGTNWITVGGAPIVNVNTGGYLAAITSALAGIFQADVGGFTKARITALAAVTGSVVVTIRSASASSMVALDAGLPTGANSIGSVTQATAASFNATVVGNGTFAVQSAMTPVTPTASIVNSAATTNATSVKSSAGTVYQITATNSGAAAAFLKIYNLAVAPTVGTSVPALTLAVPPSGTVSVNLGTMGLRLGTGISLAITNLVADTDTTVVAANQVKSAISYI